MKKGKAPPVCLQATAKVGPSVYFMHRFIADQLFQNKSGSLPGNAPQTKKSSVKPGPEQMPQIGVEWADIGRFGRQVQQVFADCHQGFCAPRRGINTAKQYLPWWLDWSGKLSPKEVICQIQMLP